MKAPKWLQNIVGLNLVAVAMIVSICLPAGAASFRAVELGANTTDSYYPYLNNLGEVVWRGSLGGYQQVFLYSNGTTAQVSNNNYNKYNPQINDSSQIIWTEDQGANDQIEIYKSGTISKVGDNPYSTPQLNAAGQVAWIDSNYNGYVYSDGENTLINYFQTNNRDVLCEYVDINSSGTVAWAGSYYDKDGDPNFPYYNLYVGDDKITNSTSSSTSEQIYFVDINNSGQAIYVKGVMPGHSLYLYNGSSVAKISDTVTSISAKISDNGNIVWHQTWGNDSRLYCYDGSVRFIDSAGSQYSFDINASGQIVWTNGTDIYLYSNGVSTKFYSVSTYDKYDFTYYYDGGQGDYYTGYVYTPTGYDGYQVGYTKDQVDENGKSGYYQITKVTSFSPSISGLDMNNDGEIVWNEYDGYNNHIIFYTDSAPSSMPTYSTPNGAVYVTSYYDKEGNKTYTPVSNGTSVGANYLGSEGDWIIWKDADGYLTSFKFGLHKNTDGTSTFYEADGLGQNIAVLFAGGIEANANHDRYYTQTLRMWRICTDNFDAAAFPNDQYGLGYEVNDVFVLAADGLNGAVDRSDGNSSDWSAITTAKGNIVAGTKANLKGLLTALGPYLTTDTTFYFWSFDHGDNPTYDAAKEYASDLTKGELCPWTTGQADQSNITGEEFYSYVSAYNVESEIYAFGQCFSYGVADNLFNKTGNNWLAAWAADGYETSIDYSWVDAWANGIAQLGMRDAWALGVYAKENDKYSHFNPANTATVADRNEHAGCEPGTSLVSGYTSVSLPTGGSTAAFSISQYEFTYYYGDGKGDYYYGYVYAPTSFQTSGPTLTVGKKLEYEPETFGSGANAKKLDGYYTITAIHDNFPASLDKKSFVYEYVHGGKAYYLNMDQAFDAKTPNSYFAWGVAYVADRTAADESGFLIVDAATHPAFGPYTKGFASAAAPSYNAAIQDHNQVAASYVITANGSSIAAPQNLAIWAVYWSQAASLLEDENYR